MAAAFWVTTVTLWRWGRSFTAGGVLALVRERTGPKGPIKLTEQLTARIAELDAGGLSLRAIAERTAVSTATVRVALGRVAPRHAGPVGRTPRPAPTATSPRPTTPTATTATSSLSSTWWTLGGVGGAGRSWAADPAAARSGDLVEAPVVITQDGQLPLAGLLLALPALDATGLLDTAQEVFPADDHGLLRDVHEASEATPTDRADQDPCARGAAAASQARRNAIRDGEIAEVAMWGIRAI